MTYLTLSYKGPPSTKLSLYTHTQKYTIKIWENVCLDLHLQSCRPIWMMLQYSWFCHSYSPLVHWKHTKSITQLVFILINQLCDIEHPYGYNNVYTKVRNSKMNKCCLVNLTNLPICTASKTKINISFYESMKYCSNTKVSSFISKLLSKNVQK